jgi:DtxR family Mn-dependent transcriptional regulator
MLSPAVEDYLKVLYKLETRTDDGAPVASGALAEAMGVSSASATNMIKRLAKLGLSTYEPYVGVALTAHGRKVALEVVRHHRLLELYLREVMGFEWGEVHDEAERLEHHISERFEAKIEEMLGHPTRDPHGHPIPTRDGVIDALSTVTLADLPTAAAATIDHVSDDDPDLLRLIEQRGLMPGAAVEVVEARPLEGLFVVRVAGAEQIVGLPVAEKVFVNVE